MWKKNMPKLIVDNDEKKEEKISDVALVTKSEFQTSSEFSQHCLLYPSPRQRDGLLSRKPSTA